MKKLLLATSNPAKFSEMKQGLAGLTKSGWRLFSLADLKISKEPKETGATFAENALLKARYYAKKAEMPALSDDGGFVIPFLNNEPGVKSARWLGENSAEEALIQHALKRLKNAKGKNRRAYLELVLCFFDPFKSLTFFQKERIAGVVASKPSAKRVVGFPYRSLLIVSPFNKYYDELSVSENAQINHRLKALKKIQLKLKKNYG